MAIITVSRSPASGGALLAEKLAHTLGYTLISREDVVREATKRGASYDELQRALLEPPSFWERLKHERRRYLAYFQAALCERVRGDRVIYHGNAGHLLLRQVPTLLCVRLIAPVESRVRLLNEREGMTREDALDYIEKSDKARQAWSHFLYGEDCLDPTLYDLVVNLRTLTIEGAVELVATAARREELQPTEETLSTMNDLVLASRVKAALAEDDRTAPAEVEVSARGGVVSLKGRLRQVSMADAVIAVAAEVEGVEEVDREQLDAPEYTV